MRSLVIGYNPDALLRGLQSIKAYLTDHPIADAGPNLVPARAGVVYDNLTVAIGAVASQKHVVALALETRNVKAQAMEKAIRTVLGELHHVLTPMDSRWLSFGFVRPGQRQSPEVPDKVTAMLIGTGMAVVRWDKAARAEYYRVWKKVVGVDEGYVVIGSPADLDFTIEGLPANAQIEIAVTAMNNGGESQLSQVATIQTA